MIILQERQNKLFVLFRLLLALLGFIPLIMIFPLITAVADGEEKMIFSFASVMAVILILAAVSFLSLRRKKLNLNAKDGFLIVFAVWVFASFIGAVPFYHYGLNFTDAFFESACTFATTGATTIGDVEALPRSLLLWRSIAHWFGGIGIILVSVALLPLLGVGGFQLIKAEETGPEKEKLTPKVTVTAKLLFFVYSVLTLILFVLYLIGGMNWFDAVCQSLAALATGGVNVRNKGLAAWDSAFIDGVTTVFLLLAGINFNLYCRALQGKLIEIKNNVEIKAYLGIFAVAAIIITFSLFPVYGSVSSAFRYASFHSASILSTAGSTTANFEEWPSLARTVLFILMFAGGCSGSTAGGIKIIRHVILWKQVKNETLRMLYPQGVFRIQINNRVGRNDVVYGVSGFIFMYLFVIMIVTLITAASGIDLFTSLSAALSITGNIGAGFGAIGPGRDYGFFADHIKWLFSFVMIAGRLEMWTVFILFTRIYWRK
ncbi:TrkH family potassium uptake protein [Treponema sp. R6D11]